MTDAVSLVSIVKNSGNAIPAQEHVGIIKPEDTNISVFQDKEVRGVNKVSSKTDLQELTDEKRAEDLVKKNTTKDSILKRIARGSINGVKNTFAFLSDSPTMTAASLLVLTAFVVPSEAMLALTLAGLAGAIIGAALSGITNEFKATRKKNQ